MSNAQIGNIKLSLGAATLIILVAACADNPDALLGKRAGGPNDGENANGENETPESLQCTAKPEGRAYVNFNGNHLDQNRTNENVGVNRARIKPYAVMANEYQRVLGLVPEAIKTAGGSFDAPPERWYAESTHSGVSMNTIFEISFAGCVAYAKAAPDLKAAPTPESAKAECTRLMRKAWNRTPSPEEIQGCTDLAMTKLASQTDVSRRWAYVCSSVLSSSQFLTF
jgi:hypothetical protein